jgi:hypothetical protein
MASKHKGGNYPRGVDEQLAEWYKLKRLPLPAYGQYEGTAPEETLRKCDANRWLVCGTYGRSPRYPGPIAHMVCFAKYSARLAAVLDNNFPGTDKYEWMEPAELVKRCKATGQSAWLFYWKYPAPPLAPYNRRTL